MVLGAGSWLGYVLMQKLYISNPKITLGGTFYNKKITFPYDVELYGARTKEEYISKLNTFNPTVVINLLRGEMEEDWDLHKSLIQYVEQNKIYYIYASSVLALDGYRNRDLVETLTANSKIGYGLFKAKCEHLLYDSSANWSILRFASVQGWVPHRPTRNEIFLRKLVEGKEIFVDQGVIQNRMYADLMLEGIVEIMSQRIQGILHFGTTDGSDELSFLRMQADIFRFSPDLIQPSNNVRNANLVCVPGRIFSLLDPRYKSTEQDTLKFLSQIPELKKIAHG